MLTVVEGDLLEQQDVADLVERRKRMLLLEKRNHVDEPFTDTAQEGEGELAAGEGVVESSKVVSHGPEATGVIRDREIPLGELAEGGLQV